MTVGLRHDDLRRRNRALVLGAVRRAGQPSRTEIAAATGLSASTISAIAADLIGEGALREVKGSETAAARRGRPQVALGLAAGYATVVAAVLMLNHFEATLIAYDGSVIDVEESRLSTQSLGRDELAADMAAVIGRLLARNTAGAAPLRVALAVQGIVDADATAMLWSPITPHGDIAFAPMLAGAVGAPATVQNDCNMIAVALRARQPDVFGDDFFAVLLSDGIGMGLMQKGRLFTGTHSSGGEFGHMVHSPRGALCRCGRRGCIEAYAGNYAVVRAATGGRDDDLPAADIDETVIAALAARARAGDGPERQAFLRAADAIGFGLGSLFALFDPAPVAIVGSGAAAFDLIEAPIREAIAQTAGGQHSGAISFVTQGEHTPLIREGCALTALTYVDENIAAAGADPRERMPAGAAA